MEPRDERRLAYEPPRLLSLTEPGAGEAACTPSGSSATGDCANGKNPSGGYCVVTGSIAASVCSNAGSQAYVCNIVGSTATVHN
jgi:hypothetical protein